MTLSRKVFFDKMRSTFGGNYTQDQVDGIDFILDTWEAKYQERTPPTQFAYVLATSFHETARRMQPIREFGNIAYFMRMYDVTGARSSFARANGNTTPGDGARYYGRGYVQLTWKSNYARATQKLLALKIITPDIDFVKFPDLVLKHEYALPILFEGMENGWFTSDTLDHEIDNFVNNDEHVDYLRARKIINGTDRAELIAGYADKFLAAITAAQAAPPATV